MLELLFSPKRAERRPWEMFFIGLFYSTIAVLTVALLFSRDADLGKYGGIWLILISVLTVLPFMYFLIKMEENKDVRISRSGRLLKEHSKAIRALAWLFLGFVVGFTIWYILLSNYSPETASSVFNAPVEVFCRITNSNNYGNCVGSNGFITGNATNAGSFFGILGNNIRVLIFTLIFSLVFGAGAIFVLIWNAAVIAVAIGVFAERTLTGLPSGFLRYLIHGIPEISAYLVAVLAGGIISVAVIRKDLKGERMYRILQDAIILIFIALIILVIAGLIEVFITPTLF